MARARCSTCQCASPVCLVKQAGRGDDVDAGIAIGAEKLREAYVVADAKAEPAEGQVDDHGLDAADIGVGFTPAFAAGEIDVEEVDLVVAGQDSPCGSMTKARLAALSPTRTAIEPIWRWRPFSRAMVRKASSRDWSCHRRSPPSWRLGRGRPPWSSPASAGRRARGRGLPGGGGDGGDIGGWHPARAHLQDGGLKAHGDLLVEGLQAARSLSSPPAASRS